MCEWKTPWLANCLGVKRWNRWQSLFAWPTVKLWGFILQSCFYLCLPRVVIYFLSTLDLYSNFKAHSHHLMFSMYAPKQWILVNSQTPPWLNLIYCCVAMMVNWRSIELDAKVIQENWPTISWRNRSILHACHIRPLSLKSVLFETARITGWARITDPSVARVEATGGGSTASRAMTTELILIRSHAARHGSEAG